MSVMDWDFLDNRFYFYSRRKWTLVFLVFPTFCFAFVVAKNQTAKRDCTVEQEECTIDQTCGMQYHDVHVHCGNRFNDDSVGTEFPSGKCTPQCQLAIQRLESTPKGKQFVQCKCQQQTDQCSVLNALWHCVSSLTNSSLIPTKLPGVFSCTRARDMCASKTDCFNALQKYEAVCKEHFQQPDPKGQPCSQSPCRDEFDNLLKDPISIYIKNCSCDEMDSDTAQQAILCFDENAIYACANNIELMIKSSVWLIFITVLSVIHF